MKTILHFFVTFLLSLRYRIKVKGLEEIKDKGGILFLANHPGENDPIILNAILWKKFRPHPVALDSLFQGWFVRKFLQFTGALPIPSFDVSSNSFKRRQIEITYEKIFSFLRSGENILIYPAGGLKNQGDEIIGGTSGVFNILQSCPECSVVLIRTTGLWGSSFSKALTGKTPDLKATFLFGAKVLLKNLLFFTPRREVTIEIEKAPSHFSQITSRLEINRTLEKWYNLHGPEPLKLVSYSFWKEELPTISQKKESTKSAFENIPEDVKTKVAEEISRLSMKQAAELKGPENLALDLGLDSLDSAGLVLFLKETFGVVGIKPSELVTVEDVMALASHLKMPESAGIEEEEEKKPLEKWLNEVERKPSAEIEGETLLEAFLNSVDRMGSSLACVDATSGEISYARLKLAVILLARQIQKYPGERIGIMLPASVGVQIAILATLLAGKVPVMINWTLGPRNLRSILDNSKIQHTISSWRFLDKLENFELDGFDDNVLLIEELRRNISLKEKLLGLLLMKLSLRGLLGHFGVRKSSEDTAVILYTSGTESFPKGVPLTNKNILSNLKDGYHFLAFKPGDVVLGVLPPFHSFGFSVTGLFPLLIGVKVVYLPNPTDGRRMAFAIDKWKATLICIAPTFLKNLLRVTTPEQFSSVRIIVCGAEKAHHEIFEQVAKLNPHAVVGEGYGITECSPILTMNPLDGKKQKGVGTPLQSVELLIVNSETMEPIPRGAEGLILARGPNLFSGYLDPTLKSPFVQVDGKKWYVTGDLGSYDEEKYLTLSGRLKRFVKIGGEMISLSAIEEILNDAAKNLNWKQDQGRPSLAVVAREEVGKKPEIALFTSFPLTLEEANNEIKKKGMSNLVRVNTIKELPFIPLLGTGKIDYRALKW